LRDEGNFWILITGFAIGPHEKGADRLPSLSQSPLPLAGLPQLSMYSFSLYVVEENIFIRVGEGGLRAVKTLVEVDGVLAGDTILTDRLGFVGWHVGRLHEQSQGQRCFTLWELCR